MNRKPTPRELVMNFEGTQRTAIYVVQSGIVSVQSSYGEASTQVGGSTAPIVARLLFREILQGAKSRGELQFYDADAQPYRVARRALSCPYASDHWPRLPTFQRMVPVSESPNGHIFRLPHQGL